MASKRLDSIIGNFLEDIIKDRPDNIVEHIIDSIHKAYPDLARNAVDNINKGIIVQRYVNRTSEYPSQLYLSSFVSSFVPRILYSGHLPVKLATQLQS